MLSAVVLGLALAGCDYGDPRLPFPDDTTDETGGPTGGGTGEAGPQDAGAPDGGLAIDAGVIVIVGGGNDAGVTGTIAEVARANPELELFMRAVDKAGMMAALLDADATMTVFAPNNSAFAAMLTELGLRQGLDALSAEQLQPILRYHLVDTKIFAGDAAAAREPLATQGGRIEVSAETGRLMLDGVAGLQAADLEARNGIIHVIDRVLLPSIADVLTTSNAHKSLSAALAKADDASPSPGLGKLLDDDEKQLTVFAPDDRAFDKWMSQLGGARIMGLESFRPDQLVPIMKYHVVASELTSEGMPPVGDLEGLGGMLRLSRGGPAINVDGVSLTMADLYCSNGVIHVVEAVLMPSISDVVTTDSRFGALAIAITKADSDSTVTRRLGDALDSPNEFTLFAPTDQAFGAAGTLPTGPALANVLWYHAVPGSPMYSPRLSDFTAPVAVLTAIDRPLVLVSSANRVTLTDGIGVQSFVVQADLFTANGVIHVIDHVLMPPP